MSLELTPITILGVERAAVRVRREVDGNHLVDDSKCLVGVVMTQTEAAAHRAAARSYASTNSWVDAVAPRKSARSERIPPRSRLTRVELIPFTAGRIANAVRAA